MSDNEQKITTLANEVTPSSKVGKMFMSGNGTDYLLYRLGPISPTIQEGYDNRHTMYFEAVSRSDKYSIIISEKIEGLDSYINTSTGAITDTNGFKGLLKNAVVITNTGTVDDVFTPMFTTGVDVFNNGTSTGYHSNSQVQGDGGLNYGIYETKILSILIHPGLYDGSNLNTQNLYIFQDRISIHYGTDIDSSTFTTNFNIPFIKEAYIYVVMLPSFSSTTIEDKDMNILQFNIDYDSFLYKDLAAMAYKTNMDQYMNTDIEKFTKEFYNRYTRGFVLRDTRGDQFINIFGLDNKVDISGSDEKTFVLGPIVHGTEYFNLYIGNFEYPDTLLAWTIYGTVNNLPGYTFTYIPSCAYKLGYASSETIADMTLKGESIFDKSNVINIYGDISPDYDSISYNRETTVNGEEDSSKSYSTSITGNFDINGNTSVSIAYFVITFANNCIKHEGAILANYNIEASEITMESQVFNYNINFDLSQILQDTSKANIIFTTLCRLNDSAVDNSSFFMTSKNAEITSSSITIPEYNFANIISPLMQRSLFKYSQTINFSIPYKDHPIILPVGLVGGNNTRTADSNGKYGDIFCEIQFPKAGDYNVKYWICVGEGIEFNNTTSTNEATDQMITGIYSGVLFAYDCSKTSGNWRHAIYNEGQQGNSLSGITVDDGGVANGITALIVRNSDNTTSNTEYTLDIKGSFDDTNSMQTTGISNCNALKDIYIHAQYLGTDNPSEEDLGWVKVNFGPTVLHPKNQSWFDSIYGSGGGGTN